jgi:hypothetical protein
MSQSARAAASSATKACNLNSRPVDVLALITRGASPRNCALKRVVNCCHSVVAAFSLAKAPSCTPKPSSERQAPAIAGEASAEPAGEIWAGARGLARSLGETGAALASCVGLGALVAATEGDGRAGSPAEADARAGSPGYA